ncbi:hypothetical protein I0C86_11085 [Plantactinospora sp. S1510]|uniref:Peptidase MA-like domain-containing protein n=1 Tax=Plantactinospora alkalitolerans TaxID=2789879 RepID=A0ABS0GTI4_9ACTN|nr:hypothetical protein [Plantactinospora alkalitolerans]MBF9129506.1 hypothetical protein [Plantactinospora alkalitolerans]
MTRDQEQQARRFRGAREALAVALTTALLAAAGCASGNSPRTTASGSASPSSTVTLSPDDAVEAMLKAQAEALLRGDEAGYLAPVDKSYTALYDHYRNQYKILRALRISSWQMMMGIPPVFPQGPGAEDQKVQLDVFVSYCFETPTCPPPSRFTSDAAQFTYRPKVSQRGDGYLITGLNQPPTDTYSLRPLPWEWDSLDFQEGNRVIVAAPPAQANRLGEVTAAAERAAKVADQYAKVAGREPPPRYVVFLAGDKEWNKWLGGQSAKYSVGYAYQSGKIRSDVVLKMSAMGRNSVESVLRHEFGHVVTATGSNDGAAGIYNTNQWITEGIAEYIEYAPKGPTASGNMNAVRSHVRRGKWSNSIGLAPLPESASNEAAAVFYGLSQLGISCMASRYGEAKMFQWAMNALHGDLGYDEAAKKYFGVGFKAVNTTCASYVRRTLNL